jgi:tetratricopeptide (TPR) repeat protein
MTKKDVDQKSQAQQDYDKGVEFIKEKDIAQAAASFHNALVGFEQDANENGMANAADKLGDICLEKKEFAKAMTYFDRAYAICQGHNDRFSLFSLERKKARVYDESGDYPKAIDAYIEVIDEYNALRDPQGAVAALETLAEIYLEAENKAKAADCYRTIASIHKHYKHRNISASYMDKAAEIERNQ